MSLIARAFAPREKRGLLQQPTEWFTTALGAVKSFTGVSVDADSALRSTAVLAAVRILAETVAMIDWRLYRKIQRGKEEAEGHPLAELLRNPNPALDSFMWRELTMASLLLRGNALDWIERNGRGEPVALWPVPWEQMQVMQEGVRLFYIWRPAGFDQVVWEADEVLHIRAFGTDGIVGTSPIGLWREAVGLGMATEEFGARFFGNGATMHGVLQHPASLSDPARANLKKSLESRHGGLSSSHKTLLLEEGMTYEKIGVAPDDAQFLETRRFQVTEIARAFRLPPHMLADMEHATFTNIEEQASEFVDYSLQPWLSRIERAVDMQLLSRLERRRLFTRFATARLRRGSVEDRWKAHASARSWGIASANDIRELEDWNPIEGGDVYIVPLNSTPAGDLGKDREPAAAGDPDDDDNEARALASRRALAQAFRPLFEDQAQRIIGRERRDVLLQVKKAGSVGLLDWIEDYYGNEHRVYVVGAVQPLFETFVRAAAGERPELRLYGANELAPAFAERWVHASVRKLREVVVAARESLLERDLEGLFDRWQLDRTQQIAKEETSSAGDQVAKRIGSGDG